MKLQEFDSKMKELLFVEENVLYIEKDNLHNGLQSFGGHAVTRVGFTVSSGVRAFELAKEAGCDALVVHHGIKVPPKNLDLSSYKRYEFLIKNDIALWSAHFVLDAHPTIGNNAQIMAAIKLKDHAPYMEPSYGAPWGRIGEFKKPLSVEEVLSRLDGRLSPETHVYEFGPREVRRVIAVSGGGAPSPVDFFHLQELGVDLFITGEVGEWHREQIRELGINLIAGGHYHTERFGLQALQPVVESWGLETAWIELENMI